MNGFELAAAAVAGLAGGFVNTLAGGGSMIMVPTLIHLGLPAGIANGTSRVPVLAQCLTSATAFARAGKLERRPTLDVAPLTVAGALAGAYVATLTPDRVLLPLLVWTMVAMALAMLAWPALLSPPPGTPVRRVMGSPLEMMIVLVAGFYGGMLQSGAGFVLLAIIGGVLRYDLVRANALKAAVMLSYIVVTVAVFAWTGKIVWEAALAMTGGAVIGAWIGARIALTRGTKWVRWLVILMVVATSAWALLR